MNTLTKKSRGHAVASSADRGNAIHSNAPTKKQINQMVNASEAMAAKVKNQGYIPKFV